MMKYLQPTFTLPASHKTKEADWDLAFLSAEEFKNKYGMTKEEYGASIS